MNWLPPSLNALLGKCDSLLSTTNIDVCTQILMAKKDTDGYDLCSYLRLQSGTGTHFFASWYQHLVIRLLAHDSLILLWGGKHQLKKHVTTKQNGLAFPTHQHTQQHHQNDAVFTYLLLRSRTGFLSFFRRTLVAEFDHTVLAHGLAQSFVRRAASKQPARSGRPSHRLAPMLPTSLHPRTSLKDVSCLFAMWHGSKGGTPIPAKTRRGAATPRHSNAPTPASNGKQRLGGAHVFRDEGMSAHPTPPPRKLAKPGLCVFCSVLFRSAASFPSVLNFVFWFCFLLVLRLVFSSCVFLVFLLPPLSVLANTCPCSVLGRVCARGPCKRSSGERRRETVFSCLVSLECTLWECFFWRMPKQAYTVPCRSSHPNGQGVQILRT